MEEAGASIPTPLSTDAHCAMLTALIRDRHVHIMDGFKLFVQLFSAIVAGAVTLRLHYGGASADRFTIFADALVGLVAVAAAVIIGDNTRAWRDYRRKLSQVAGRSADGMLLIEGPNTRKAFRIEATMLLAIAIATIGFWVFNPLAG